MTKFNPEQFIKSATNWIRQYAEQARVNGFVVGVSGGIDSAVVSALCARTGFPVLCVEMPIHQDPSHTMRSSKHIAWLKEKHILVSNTLVDLTEAFDVTEGRLIKGFPNGSQPSEGNIKLAEANTRARLRMVTLYYYANSMGLLVAGTGNKVEDFGLGYFSKGGDGTIDFSVLGDIMKTEVYAVAEALGINQDIIDAKPTDGLWANSPTDEETIGASYPELEWAMLLHEKNPSIVWILEGDDWADSASAKEALGASSREDLVRKIEVMRIYLTRNRANQHKMNPIPVFNSAGCRDLVTGL